MQMDGLTSEMSDVEGERCSSTHMTADKLLEMWWGFFFFSEADTSQSKKEKEEAVHPQKAAVCSVVVSAQVHDPELSTGLHTRPHVRLQSVLEERGQNLRAPRETPTLVRPVTKHDSLAF